ASGPSRLSLHDALPILSGRSPSAFRISRNIVISRFSERSLSTSKQNLKTRRSSVRSFLASHTSPKPPSPSFHSITQPGRRGISRSEEHTSELQSRENLV